MYVEKARLAGTEAGKKFEIELENNSCPEHVCTVQGHIISGLGRSSFSKFFNLIYSSRKFILKKLKGLNFRETLFF
jgi:hypothetical protein